MTSPGPHPGVEHRGRTARRAWVLALWLLAVLAAAWQVSRSHFTADLSAFLPRSPDPQQRVLIEQLEAGAPARTLLMGIAGGDGTQRAEASRALAAALRASGRFAQVSNGEREAFAAVGAWLFEHRYQLSPAVSPERFGAQGLRDAIDETLSMLGTPAGGLVKPLLERDPSGEMQRIAETLIPQGGPRSEGGVWVSRTAGASQRALLLALTQAPGGDLDAQQAAIDTVHRAFAPAAARGLTLELSGAPLFAVQSRAQIEREVHFLAIAGTLVMSALLLAAFASPLALLVAALPVATGVLAGIAAVGLAFGTVHGVTLGFGSTLIGESVDYAIYYLIQARSATHGAQDRHGAGWRAWVAAGWPTVRLGLLTSVCGFAALVFSGFPGLAQLGVFSIAGLVAAALATRYVLPVLRPDGAAGQGLRGLLGRVAGSAVRGLPRLRWALVAMGVAAAVLLALRGGHGELWRADLQSLSPVPREAIERDQRLRTELSGGDARPLVVVQATDLETALARAEAVGLRLDALVERGVLGGYDSVARFLPSLATQRARQAALPDTATLRAALAQATQGGPLAAARLEPFVAEVGGARGLPALTLEAVRASPVASLVDALLVRRADGSAAALLPLQAPLGADGSLDLAAVRAALTGAEGTQLIELGTELGDLYRRYLHEAQWQALLGALGVVALVALSLRSARRVLAVCQPLLLAVLLTMAGLVLAGVPLGILHLVGLLLVVAVGSNYALFFDLLRHDTGALAGAPAADTLASLLLANLTTVASFGLLAMSSIGALSAIGQVVAPGALLALLLSAAFAPQRGHRRDGGAGQSL